MTLVLTRASKDYVIQVTDRLVTVAGAQFDTVANKNVLFCARNGVITLGYTGLAYLGGVPTDQWIAEKLSGRTFARGESLPAFMAFPVAVRDVGQSLRQLKAGLEEVPVEPKWRAQWQASSFDVSISGWQWTRRRARPVMAWLSKPEGSLSVELDYMKPRHWFWDRGPDKKRFRFELQAAPASNISGAQMYALATRLEDCDCDRTESTIVGAIREVSGLVSEVGPHCISILVAPPNIARARVRYLPLGQAASAIVSTSRAGTFSVPAAFTPWIVGPGGILAPAINAGTSEVRIGPYLITLEAPNLPGPGIRGLFASQQRPRMP
jgi:hypothetical protein